MAEIRSNKRRGSAERATVRKKGKVIGDEDKNESHDDITPNISTAAVITRKDSEGFEETIAYVGGVAYRSK